MRAVSLRFPGGFPAMGALVVAYFQSDQEAERFQLPVP